ncbi:aminopeptidase G. Metallo peptidase. MEROPS family M01 [Arthrobacter crystallopoietes]|uniref:Aminopeptidase N n=1 Tax=Crystallibacter crystallopoietes TaxID=37928 RepID=A0A1H1GN94_9MICC|nr:aminopeptidase G. Metallo peptidase. MEROPS family M01 [Arthrobacter crystallopoietes]
MGRVKNENLSRSEARGRSELIEVENYDVALDLRSVLDPEATGYISRSVITFKCNEPGAGTFVDFIHDGIHSVMLNGIQLDPDAVVDGSRIHLADLAAENQVTIVGTALYSRSGEGLHRFVDPADGRIYLYTQYEPADARRVFANFEQPDIKASFTFNVAAPSDWQVSSNSPLAVCEEMASTPGFSIWRFAPTERISTYITTVLAGPYHVVEDSWKRTLADGTELEVPLGAYCRSSLAEAFDAAEIFAITKAGLDFFHELFEYPYPFGKYEQAFVPEYNLGAMENPGLVTFTETYVFKSRATDAQYQARGNTIMHEMAHMWFGNLVTMQWWDDLWLKESFADYMGSLALVEATRWKDAWVAFANRRKAWAYVQDQLPTTHPIVADIRDLEAAKQNFDGITYAKGASVLKQLVAYVGFDAFIGAARQYFRDNAYSNTTLDDFLTVLSDASGRDMARWSSLWLQTAGISTLVPEIEYDGGRLARVRLLQDAMDPVTARTVDRPHRLRLGLYDFDAGGALVRTDSVELDLAGAATDVPELAGRPAPALLLVNDNDLTYAKVRFDAASLQTVLSALDKITDPLARALCWSALWNMTRDGLLAPADYLGAVERFAPAESDNGVLQVLLDCARTALDRYLPAAERTVQRERFVDSVRLHLGKAAAGSDQQLTWARSLAALSRSTPRCAGYIADLLKGTERVAGLTLDTDLRWRFWQAIAATGHASQEQLDTELASDLTAAGRAGHLTAMTARPDPAVKAQAWADAVAGSELSNQLLDATIDGFTAAGHELLDPYIEPYFQSIESVWAQKSIEIASRIVRGFYPLAQDLEPGTEPRQHAVVVRTDEWLAGHSDAPAALRRIVIEQRDHLLRALTVQGRQLVQAF